MSNYLTTTAKIISTNNIYHGGATVNAMPNGNLTTYHNSITPYTNTSGTQYGLRFWNSDIFGEIYINEGSGTQVIPSGNTYVKVQNFTNNGVYRNCLPDYINNEINVYKPGVYRLGFSFSTYTDTNNCELRTCVFINNKEVTEDLHTLRRVINANQASASAINGFITITGYSKIDIRTKHNLNNAVTVTPVYGSVNIMYISDMVS